MGPPRTSVRIRAGALLLLLALLAPGAVLGQSTHWNRIVFVDPDGRLATVRPDGLDPRLLTDAGEPALFPAWGPSGERIAAIFATARGGAVRVVDLREGAEPEPTELYRSVREPPFYLYWSPDGARVSFLANHPEGGIALHLADADGERERVLALGRPFYWQWAADGSRLLLHSGFGESDARLGFTDAEADTLGENLAAPGYFRAPGISPSGRYVAFGARAADRTGRLVLRPTAADPEGVVRVLPHEGHVAFGWSPTADVLALTSPPEPVPLSFGPIRLLDAATGELRVLTERPAFAFFWSPDGRRIAYLAPPPRTPGGQIAGAGPHRVQARPALLELRVVEVAPEAAGEAEDGAASGAGRDRALALFAPSQQFLTQFLPYFDQYALSHRLWAPDGSALVVPAVGADGRARVTVVPLEGEAREIAEGDMAFWNVR